MKKDIYNIAVDYFKGRIEPENLQYLNNWLDESSENREVFTDLKRVWELTGTLDNKLETVINTEWDNFVKLRNNAPIKQEKSVKRMSFGKFNLRIAAILIPVVFVLSMMTYVLIKPEIQGDKWITVVTKEEKLNITLPDGSEVWINRNSQLQYPPVFTNNYRVVRLTGEAYFSVVKSGSRFKVDAGKTTIQVLGTRFSVSNYQSDLFTEVVVEEGKVLFNAETEQINKVTLTAGEKGTYSPEKDVISKEIVSTGNSLAWVKQRLVFNNVSLMLVIKDLDNYFGERILISKNLENCFFSGEFNNPRIENVLEVISLTLGCEMRHEGEIYYLEGGTCMN